LENRWNKGHFALSPVMSLLDEFCFLELSERFTRGRLGNPHSSCNFD
jgi:hypothetical protein